MLPTTLTDFVGQIRHDVATLEKERAKLVTETDGKLATIDQQLNEKRRILDDYLAFFEFQHHRDGGTASLQELHRVLDDGNKLSPDEQQLADAIGLHVPQEQRPDVPVTVTEREPERVEA